MKRTTLLVLLALLGFHYASAQKQTNVWYFGLFGGLDFNSGAPVVLTDGQTQTNEGVASISDSLGNLLFYTDGENVWNKNNALMPNGTGLFGSFSTTQTIIVPNPGDSDLYYIFTLDEQGNPRGFNYSVVDMTLDGGNGDVSVKNTLLHAAPMTEKVCAVYHCNNHDIWVMSHENNSDAFTAYLVTDNGISAPVISHTGIVHTDMRGQMKFSSDGKKLACAINLQDTTQVFDFDNKTGVVSNPATIALGQHVYGLEFSPDNSKLYGTAYVVATSSEVYQIDMNAPDLQASFLMIAGESDDPYYLYGMQLASDNKIYISKNPTPFIYVINSPNLAGPACDFVPNAINVDPLGFGTQAHIGLPGFIQSYFNPDFPFEECSDLAADFTSSDTVICVGDCISFSEMSGCTTDFWQWNFNGASPSSSLVQNPSGICYNASGDFDVKLVASNGCIDDSITKTITVVAPDLDAGEDKTITPGGSAPLNATGDVVTYQWNPATGLSATNIANPVASPAITTIYLVSGADANGCGASDSITVFVTEGGECNNVAIPDAFTPNGDSKNDVLRVLPGKCIETMRFLIYNRWGEKVFETDNPSSGWDGTYKGEPAPISTFAYFFEGTLITGGNVTRKGSVTLIR